MRGHGLHNICGGNEYGTFLGDAELVARGNACVAPVMLAIRGVTDTTALQSAFEAFWYCGNIRGACQVVAFAAQLGALALQLPGRHRA
jgi:hypothetical protein